MSPPRVTYFKHLPHLFAILVRTFFYETLLVRWMKSYQNTISWLLHKNRWADDFLIKCLQNAGNIRYQDKVTIYHAQKQSEKKLCVLAQAGSLVVWKLQQFANVFHP